jgi:predicted transcriptional regulator
MNRRLNLDVHLQNTLMTIKRAKVTSGRVARSLGVSEHDVILWRAGVTVPKSADCARLSELLDVDVAWLCAGQA